MNNIIPWIMMGVLMISNFAQWQIITEQRHSLYSIASTIHSINRTIEGLNYLFAKQIEINEAQREINRRDRGTTSL
jgi:hypothetical protein